LFIADILSVVDTDFILNLCLSQYLLVYTYQGSDNDKSYNLIRVSISIGGKLLNRYFNILKTKYNKENDCNISYSDWMDKWSKESEFNYILDDSLRTVLGCKILDILESCDMLKKVLTKPGVTKSEYVLKIVENFGLKDKERIVSLPTKLPIIVKPKKYGKVSGKKLLGGYLLNDEKFSEDLLIEKKAYGTMSELSDNNYIYDMVNNINSTPFMINRVLLEFIQTNGYKYNLLIDAFKGEGNESNKLTKYQENKIKSHNGKLLLQDSILVIAQFYSKFPEIYFPVRIDQRGRVYCMPNFLNYQSNELSKALILFAEPGIIKRDDLESIGYLKAYGANCYGGIIGKSSYQSKLNWVNKNIDNIVNYENGILLSKAKDKFLFLAFCIEYSRFYNFYVNEDMMEFKTYLPIQLDATCNGFQHMALLSNEKTLFKELNLTDGKSSEPPKDFYNFLLHKIKKEFENKITSNQLTDESTGGSYERLNKFVWDRSYVKKAVMTIPYNASRRSMKKYITDSLIVKEGLKENDKDNTIWYTDSERNKNILINDKDISLLINSIMWIIQNDFSKIKKLIKYLKNIASIFNVLELPITWTLPTGITIRQSYLETKSTSITPFMYSKVKLNLKVTVKDKYDKRKQIRALMPNLIHSLDASSLSLLLVEFYNSFSNKNVQFFSVHDCFGTTCDKVFRLKTILASVYTELYSSESYLIKFDDYALNVIENNTDYKVDRLNRKIDLPNGKSLLIHDVNWVMNKTLISNSIITKIDSQYIVV